MSAVNAVPKNAAQAAYEREVTEEEAKRIRARKTPPKKFADRQRTVLTPEWVIWNRSRQYNQGLLTIDEIDDDQISDYAFNHFMRIADAFGVGDVSSEHEMYFPEEHDKELGDGAWIIVIDPPVTVQWDDFKVPPISIWWARPHVLNCGPIAGRLPYQAVIQTPAGDLHLWPHEYVVCSDPAQFIGEEGTTIHNLGGSPVLDEEKMFYLQQRGIPQQEAAMMLLGDISQGDFIYVTMDEAAVEAFIGVGTRPGSDIIERWKRGDWAA